MSERGAADRAEWAGAAEALRTDRPPVRGADGPDMLRWRRPVALVLLVVVAVVIGSHTRPRPALHGPGLVLLLSAVAVLLGGAALWFGPAARPRSRLLDAVLFAVVLAGSMALAWTEPGGIGFFGGFVIAGTATARLPGRTGTVVTALSMAGLAVADLLAADQPLSSVLVSELGLVGFYRLGLYARWLRQRTAQSERLLAELERTREAQLAAAALAERQRVAREMHDVLAHSLSGLLLHLEGARLLAVRDGARPQLVDTLERAHRLAQAGLGEARQAIGTLRDDDLPGPERLAALTAAYERDTGVPCTLTVSGAAEEPGAAGRLDPGTRLTLYRVAQEALTNARRHARPDRVDVRLDHSPDGVRLTVEDHAAPPPDAPEAATRAGEDGADTGRGYGVTGMRERAELLGGTLDAARTPTGFRVTLWVPAR